MAAVQPESVQAAGVQRGRGCARDVARDPSKEDGQQHGTPGGQASWTWKASVPQRRAPSFRTSWAKDVSGQLNFAG